MTAGDVIVVRHHGLREVGQGEALDALALPNSIQRIPADFQLDTRRYSNDVEGHGWEASHLYVAERASELRAELLEATDARAAYFGLAEVPHVLALGAYVGDEWTFDVYDHHRDTGTWTWPTTESTLSLDVSGLPRQVLEPAGVAAVRIELSATIHDADSRDLIAAPLLADIRIVPRNKTPSIAECVRSVADVIEVRRTIRSVLATLRDHCPTLEVVHLFVAAPTSACFVIGQELRPRNSPPIQTYRYRRTSTPTTRAAFLISGIGPEAVEQPVSDDGRARAQSLRTGLWLSALKEVEAYALRMATEAPAAERWYSNLILGPQLDEPRPFPELPLVSGVIPQDSTVDPEPIAGSVFYGYQRDRRRWRLNDGFLLKLSAAFEHEPDTARSLVRMFMFHESLHVAHGIEKAKVEEVGKFANALEHVDYSADLYAILHELQLRAESLSLIRKDFALMKETTATLIDMVIRSIWLFEIPAPMRRVEFRRMRRYFNWYWQQIRVRMSTTPLQLARALARKPIVEIAGIEAAVESRRHFALFGQYDPGVGLEMAVILDNDELWRIPTQPTVSLEVLLDAMSNHRHEDVQQSFRAIFANVEGSKYPLPPAD